MIIKFKDKKPNIHNTAFVAESADLIGDVTVEENASIWFRAVLRGDINYIKVGKNSNIQDGCVLHVTENNPCVIGDNVTVGHNAILHGCTVKDGALIGMGAIVLDGAEIGEEALVAAGALVPSGKIIPARSLVIGSPAKVVTELTEEYLNSIRKNTKDYVVLAKIFLTGENLY